MGEKFVERFYQKAVQSIDKIPDSYLKNYISGVVSSPFGVGTAVDMMRGIRISKPLLTEKDFYSLGAKLIVKRTKETHSNKKGLEGIVNVGAFAVGLATTCSLIMLSADTFSSKHGLNHEDLLLYLPMLVPFALDITNYIQRNYLNKTLNEIEKIN